jgi:cell division GTPase FtsZ
MDEVGEITDFVTAETASSTNIIWGTCTEESLGEKIIRYHNSHRF